MQTAGARDRQHRGEVLPAPVEPRAYGAVDMVVWSGTGNTLRVAERIAQTARAQGSYAHVWASTSAVETQSTSRRLLGLLAPTHGFTAPWPLVKAAFTLPGVRGTDVFVLVTRGGTRVGRSILSGFEGTAAYVPAALLALRLLFYVWLISLPIAAVVSTALLGALGIPTGWVSAVLSFLVSYLWIAASVWFAYGALWLGLSVPGLRLVLSRVTLTRLYRRYRGPNPPGEVE